MDSVEFTASVRAELAEDLRKGRIAEEVRRAYAELEERELTPMRPVRRDRDSDLMLDNRDRANDMRGAR